METTETANYPDGCLEQEAEECMPSVGGELEGEPQPTPGVASDYSWTGNPVGITEDQRVHAHITDSVGPLVVEICSPSPVQTTSHVSSAPLSAQASAPASMEPSAPEPMETSSSPSEQLTPQLPLQCSHSPSPPLTGMFAIQAQTCASLPVNTFGQTGVHQAAATATVSQAVPSAPGQVSAPHLTQTPPLTPAAQPCASPAMQISPLCFAPLPAQTPPPAQWAVEEEVAARFGACLEEVGALERRREALVRELLRLEQPMAEAAQAVRAELAHAYGQLTRAQLQLLWRQEDVRQAKRKLLNVTRHSIQSQVDLSALQYEVAQSVIMQEELQSQVLDHLQELAQLREDHKKQMDHQNNLKKRRRRRTIGDLSHGRRFSADLSRYTSGSMKMLEDWYEPRVLALLRRRQTAEEVLRRSRELTEELRTRLLPLQEEAHNLTLQKTCLEQKIALMEREREETATRCKESIFYLEETMRELKAGLQIQRMANAELKQLKNSLILELQSYGCSISIGEHTDTASGGAEDL